MSDNLFETLKIAEAALMHSAEIRQLHSTSVKIALEQAEAARKLGLSNDIAIKNITTEMEHVLMPAVKILREQSKLNEVAAVLGLSSIIQTQQTQIPKSMEPIVDAVKIQKGIVESAASCVQTPAIRTFMESCRKQQLTLGMESFMKAISSAKVTEASNIAFLKGISGNVSLDGYRFPYGWKSIINRMNKPTAEKLARITDIHADIENKNFVADEGNGAAARVGELNVIASSMDLFSEITFHDLIILQDILAEEAAFALEDTAGKKIFEIIKNWNACIDFDHEHYYHCRSIKKDEAPYTKEDMKRAPRSCVGPGRYNYAGVCHYYFADTVHGAKTEVMKHHKECSLQTAKLRTVQPIKLIDFSEENTKKIKFLDYIRFDVKDTAMLPREYLIPQFVAICCKKSGIEGIKYYGSKEYNNYVAWKDGYFEIIDMWVDE